MEEDIKILEKLASQKYDEKLLNSLYMIREEDEVYILNIYERQAIENLLEAYKQEEKMIDLMAEQIWLLDNTNEEDCFVPREYSDINDCIKKKDCRICIKEYFRKKVKDE